METVVPLLAAVAIAVVMRWEWSQRPRTRAWRMLREMKNVSIADVKDGAPARITGRVGVLDETLTSPVGERPCVAFRLEIATLAQGRQQIVLRRDEHRAFAVADQSGQATIEGTVLVGLDWEHDWSALPPRCHDMLEAAGVEMEGAFFRRRFAYRQALIEAGDRVSACGLAFFEPDPTAPAVGLRAPALQPHLRGMKRHPVAVAYAADPAPAQELDEIDAVE